MNDIHMDLNLGDPKMYTTPEANPAFAARTGPLGWLKGVEQWLDDRGRPAWFAAMILGFIFVWPVGLGILLYMIWSKRMFSASCGRGHDPRHFWGHHHRSRGDWEAMKSQWRNMGETMRPTGNAAFDAYKADTINRLQEEQKAFEAFLQRLRESKDKAEFDAFMEERARANAAAANLPATPGEDTPRNGEY